MLLTISNPHFRLKSGSAVHSLAQKLAVARKYVIFMPQNSVRIMHEANSDTIATLGYEFCVIMTTQLHCGLHLFFFNCQQKTLTSEEYVFQFLFQTLKNILEILFT